MSCRISNIARRGSHHASVSVAASSTNCSTLLPFLYQTHSIRAGGTLGASRHTTTALSRPISRCLYTCSHRHSSRQPAPGAEEDEWGPVPKDYGRHTSSRNRARTSSRNEKGDIGQPHGRQTRDRFRDQRIQDVPFEHLKALSSSPDPNNATNQSTLTDNERKAFYRLFQSLTPTEQQIDGLDLHALEYERSDDSDGLGGFEDGYDSSGLLEQMLTGNTTKHPNSLSMYPPALRNMAQQAEARMRLHQRSKSILQDDSAEYDAGISHPALVKERQEAKRIETAMYAADTDQALWAILETEIFSNIRIIQAEEDRHADEEAAQHEAEQYRRDTERSRLHDAHDAVKKEIATRGRKDKSIEKLEDADIDSNEPAIHILDAPLSSSSPPTSSMSPSFTPEALATMSSPSPSQSPASPTPPPEPLFTHQPAIYAHLTALALTLLTKRTAYTPLALSLLPAIQRIGLTAYALCASTALYNTLLTYQYRVFHAAHAMLATLAEMDAAGVPMDAETLAIVHGVRDYRSAARGARLGGMARAVEQLWSRAEEGKALDAWARRIEARLERRAVEGVQRRKAMGELRGEGAIG